MPQSEADVSAALRKVFGFREFRPNQEQIVRAILEKRDVFAVMPTGGGKSLCYQLPAVLMAGTCMVISPLISLMKDQVDGARANGIRAAFLNSSLLPDERDRVTQELLANSLDLIYVAPERFVLDHFRQMLGRVKISMAVIDEAHCISEWGHDFRPDYLSLSDLVTLFPDLPVAAFTATATHLVQQDILDKLALRTPLVVRASFDRPNLFYDVRFKEHADIQLVSLIKKNAGKAGIIYRTSRKSVDETAAMLKARGFRALPYHAGLSDDDRQRHQEAFIRDEVEVIVATIAFGMGIDKSNVRFVIHADLPKSIENYYQETGRAGRDGETAQCTLLFAQGDISKLRFFIDGMTDDTERKRAFAALSKVISFASTSVCRRRSLLDYFGEHYPLENCSSCDICLGTREAVDCTRDAQMLLSAIVRTEERFGAMHIVDIVLGSRNRKIRDFGHDRLKTYGVGKGRSKQYWRQLVDELLAQKAIAKSEGLYPTLFLLPKGVQILKQEESIAMVRVADHIEDHIVDKRREKESYGRAEAPAEGCDQQLFELLRILRKQIAQEQGIPPYVVFSDRSLHDMASIVPRSAETMLSVSGVGETKLERYGRRFLRLIDRYCSDHPERAA
ncbi:MAG: DNA helicase RecQ [Chlorobiaceae bacterium]|nr:DNA helicase RecQ [Chlorobiaceae bacterium]